MGRREMLGEGVRGLLGLVPAIVGMTLGMREALGAGCDEGASDTPECFRPAGASSNGGKTTEPKTREECV